MSDEYYAWLKDLKAGDAVIARTGYYGFDIAKVERITPTQIIVGGERYRKTSGYEVGEHSYNRKRIEEATPEMVAKVRKSRLVEKLSKVNWESHALERLNEVWAIIKPTPTAAGCQEKS